MPRMHEGRSRDMMEHSLLITLSQGVSGRVCFPQKRCRFAVDACILTSERRKNCRKTGRKIVVKGEFQEGTETEPQMPGPPLTIDLFGPVRVRIAGEPMPRVPTR